MQNPKNNSSESPEIFLLIFLSILLMPSFVLSDAGTGHLQRGDAGSRIIGKISDAVSGEGIANTLIRTDRGDSTISESDGTYTLILVYGCGSPLTLTVEVGGYDTYTETLTPVCEETLSKDIFMKSPHAVSGPKAIIVAGGPLSDNNLWQATRMLANSAYRTLLYQGFTSERIFYLSPDTESDIDGNGISDDIDGPPILISLENAVTQWASDAESLTIFLTGHGGNRGFRMSDTDILSSADLDGWLDTLQESVAGAVVVVCDMNAAGMFLSGLRPSDGQERMLIGGASAGQGAAFLNDGLVAFSKYFWRGIFFGKNLFDAFTLAAERMTAITDPNLTDWQTPFLDDNGDGLSNQGDGFLAKTVIIGDGTVFPGADPVIGEISLEQDVGGGVTVAAEVTDPDGIAAVWAVLIPPGFVQGERTVTAFPGFDLLRTDGDRYEGTSEAFHIGGVWQVVVFAADRNGRISAPRRTAVTIENPLTRKAVIVAGGTLTGPLWSATEENAGLAYRSLRFQGYSDADIYFMSPSTSSSGADALAGLSGLEYALGDWAMGSTQDVVLYMVGEGDAGGFQLGETASVSPEVLDDWLDLMQNEIPGPVTVVYDACRAGRFLSVLTPPSGKERILIAGSSEDQGACFLSGGDVSFSGFFWRQVAEGETAGKAFSDAGEAISVPCGGQTPLLDDNGDGRGNDAGDGLLAAGYAIGLGIATANERPVIGSVSPDQVLEEEASAEIWAAGLNTLEGIEKVWAVVTPPEPSGVSCDTVSAEIGLVYDEGLGRYAGMYSGESCGDYTVTVYAKDTTGAFSEPLVTRVRKETGDPLPGDVNGDCRVNLNDAIILLNILSAQASAQIRPDYTQIDINGDNRPGIAEVIYALKKAAKK